MRLNTRQPAVKQYANALSDQKQTIPCLSEDKHQLVYLTWTTLFVSARQTGVRSRKQPKILLASPRRDRHPTEIIPILGRSNSVDICISLNDVKAFLAERNVRLDGEAFGNACRSNRVNLARVWLRQPLPLAVISLRDMTLVEPSGIEPLTS